MSFSVVCKPTPNELSSFDARIVQHATFGHLNPKAGTRTAGTIRFCTGCYGDCVILRDTFASSPQTYAVVHGIFDRDLDLEEGAVYQWQGDLIVYKNGNARLSAGHITRIL